jgi:hypothetical protein
MHKISAGSPSSHPANPVNPVEDLWPHRHAFGCSTEVAGAPRRPIGKTRQFSEHCHVMNPAIDLTGRVALVTGGARRIGAAIVRGLHAEGASVVIHCPVHARSGTPVR